MSVFPGVVFIHGDERKIGQYQLIQKLILKENGGTMLRSRNEENHNEVVAYLRSPLPTTTIPGVQDLYIKIVKFLDTPEKVKDCFNAFFLSLKSNQEEGREVTYCETINNRVYLKKAWLSNVVQFAQRYDADIVKLIDAYFLQQNNVFEDNQATTFISSLVEEIKRYSRAILIFDLDSIAMIKKEHSGIKESIKAPCAYALESGNNSSTFAYSI